MAESSDKGNQSKVNGEDAPVEQERIAREKAEAQRGQREQAEAAERERKAREQAEAERQQREKAAAAERERKAREQAEAELEPPKRGGMSVVMSGLSLSALPASLL